MKLVSIPANPVPDDAVTGMLKTPDGVHLRFARFAPPAGRRGTVCILPGRTEWIEKYFETVRDLRNRGFAVAVIDWRGQGLSDRALSDRYKGYVGSFSQFDTDLETFMREVVLPDCPPPIFALAHSMGATILLRAIGRGQRWFDRVVLSAPMLGIAFAQSAGIAGGLLRVVRWAGFGGIYVPGRYPGVLDLRPFAGNPLTSDPVRFARSAAILEAEPALALGGPTVAWADAAFRAMRAMQRAELSGAHPPADPDHRRRARRHRLERRDRRLRHVAARWYASGRGRLAARAVDGAGSLPLAILRRVRRLRPGHAAVLDYDRIGLNWIAPRGLRTVSPRANFHIQSHESDAARRWGGLVNFNQIT